MAYFFIFLNIIKLEIWVKLTKNLPKMMFQGRGKSLRVFVRANNLAIGDNVKYTKYVLYELYVFDQFHIIDKLNRKANCFITERIVYITIYLIICCVCCCCLCLLTPIVAFRFKQVCHQISIWKFPVWFPIDKTI